MGDVLREAGILDRRMLRVAAEREVPLSSLKEPETTGLVDD